MRRRPTGPPIPSRGPGSPTPSRDYYEWGVDVRPRIGKDGRPIIDPATGAAKVDRIPYVRVRPSAELTRAQTAAIIGADETISRTGEKLISVRMGDKRAALRDLAQHLGLFTDKVQHTHEHTILVEHAAAELTQKIALLTSRAREPVATVDEAEIVAVPMVADEREQQAA
jgi:hypothetical protein